MALAMGTHWVCNFVIGQLFLAAVSILSVPILYCFFGSVCLYGARYSNQLPIRDAGQPKYTSNA